MGRTVPASRPASVFDDRIEKSLQPLLFSRAKATKPSEDMGGGAVCQRRSRPIVDFERHAETEPGQGGGIDASAPPFRRTEETVAMTSEVKPAGSVYIEGSAAMVLGSRFASPALASGS